ncbi:MAG: cupin domain-containing protein [Ilumatobacteraceae bacterium]
MSDLGGDAPCWAHLFDDVDVDRFRPQPISVDLTRLSADGRGAIWSLPHGGDLDANLVVLSAGDEIAAHVNDEVDVLFVVVDGSGEVLVDAWSAELSPGVVVLVPSSCSRTVRAGTDGIRYLTVHRRRGLLQIRPCAGDLAGPSEGA